MRPDLSFEEFRAIRNRRSVTKPPNARKSTVNKEPIQSKDEEEEDLQERTLLGENGLVEWKETQILYISLLLIDIGASFLFCVLQLYQNSFLLEYIEATEFVSNGIRAFGSFATVFFGLEIVLTWMTFRSKCIGHLGYMLDLVVVPAQLYCEYIGLGRAAAVLDVVRLWRLGRLMALIVGEEVAAHQVSQRALRLADERSVKMQVELKSLQDDIHGLEQTRDNYEALLMQVRH